MQARMKERLQVRFEVPDFLGSAPFPPMMLQTLIENSIKHGLEPKIEGGTIVVRACVDGVDPARRSLRRRRRHRSARGRRRRPGEYPRTPAAAVRRAGRAGDQPARRAAPAPRSSCRTR
jgi:hypothetical protein